MTPLTASVPLTEWMTSHSELITRRRCVATSDILSTRRRFLEFSNGLCLFRTIGKGRFSGYSEARAQMGDLCFRFRSWDCDIKCEALFPRGRDQQLVLQIPLKGDFRTTDRRRSVTVEPGQLLVLTAPGDVRRQWRGSSDLLTVMVDRKVIKRIFGHETSQDIAALDDFQMAVVELGSAQTLVQVIHTAIRDLRDDTPTLTGSGIQYEFSNLLARLVFKCCAQARGVPGLPSSGGLPYYMVRAERFLKEHLERKIDIRTLARVASVSARSLYYGFRKYRQATPAQWQKQIRLRRASQELRGAVAKPGTVTAIARRVGYSNKSQFTRDYKRMFGESPSATLHQNF